MQISDAEVESARRAGVRFLGPNTVGFVNAWDPVAHTISTLGELDPHVPGPVAVVGNRQGVGNEIQLLSPRAGAVTFGFGGRNGGAVSRKR